MNAKSIIAKLTESPIYLDYLGDALPGRLHYRIKKLKGGEFELWLKFKSRTGDSSEITLSTVDRRDEVFAFLREALQYSSDDALLIDELNDNVGPVRGSIDSVELGDTLRNPYLSFVRELIAKGGMYVPATRGLEKEHHGSAEYDDVVDYFARVKQSTVDSLARSYHIAVLDTSMEATDQMQSIVAAQNALGIKVALLVRGRLERDVGYLVFVPEAEFDKFVRRVTASEFRA